MHAITRAKYITPKHLSATDFLLPAISPSQKIKNLFEMNRGWKIQKCRFKLKQLHLSVFQWLQRIFFQKYITSQNIIIKTKCPTRKKCWQPKTCQKRFRKNVYAYDSSVFRNVSSSSYWQFLSLFPFYLFFFISIRKNLAFFNAECPCLFFFCFQFSFLFTAIIFIHTHTSIFFLRNCPFYFLTRIT